MTATEFRLAFGRALVAALSRPPSRVTVWCEAGALYHLEGDALIAEARRVGAVIAAGGWCRARECLTCSDTGTVHCVWSSHAWMCGGAAAPSSKCARR